MLLHSHYRVISSFVSKLYSHQMILGVETCEMSHAYIRQGGKIFQVTNTR
jgi:hypothetical protein